VHIVSSAQIFIFWNYAATLLGSGGLRRREVAGLQMMRGRLGLSFLEG